MTNFSSWCRAFVLLGLLGMSLPGAIAAELIKLTDKQVHALGIATQPLQSAQVAQASGLPAQVVIPNQQLRLITAPVAGMVVSVAVAAHEPVKSGQLLARVQSAGLMEMQREYLHAGTEADLARDALKRDEGLFKEGIIAESRLLATRGRHAQAMTSLNERRQALRLYGMSEGTIQALHNGKGMSSTLDIVAPISGVVLEQMATMGSRVEAAAPLFKVAQLDPLWLEIQAPMALAENVKPGTPVTAGAASGKVVSVGRQVNAANQTVTIRAQITQGAASLHAGQFIEARVQAAIAGASHWIVPAAALMRQQGKVYLFVQVAGGFRLVEAKVLGESGASATISGAFKGSEQIAVTGIAAIKAVVAGAGGE